MAETFLVICGQCQARLNIKIKNKSKTVKCPKCGAGVLANPNQTLIIEDMKRSLRILSHMSYIDGTIDLNEQKILDRLKAEIQKLDSSADLRKIVDEGTQGQRIRFPRGQFAREQLMKSLVQMIAADGKVDASEEHLAKQYAKKLKVDYQEILAAARESISVATRPAPALADSDPINGAASETPAKRTQARQQDHDFLRSFLVHCLRSDQASMLFGMYLVFTEQTMRQDWLRSEDAFGPYSAHDRIDVDDVKCFQYDALDNGSAGAVIQLPRPELTSEILFICIYMKNGSMPMLYSFELAQIEADKRTYAVCRYIGQQRTTSITLSQSDAVYDIEDPENYFRLLTTLLGDD